MGVKEEIDLDFIANSINMDKSYKGYYLLVEGETDESFFSKFISTNNCNIQSVNGKENVFSIIEKLNLSGFKRVIAIVDKDIDWINNKILTYPKNIFVTDFHDVEIMCFASDSFINVIHEFCSKTKIRKFSNGINIINHLIQLSKPIGFLRIYNFEKSTNLAFKPSGKKEKELDYTKFICKDSFSFKGYDILIDTIKRYYNQALSLDTSHVTKTIEVYEKQKFKDFDLIHGHDLVKIFVIGIKKTLGISNCNNVSYDEVERALRLAYSENDFKKSKLRKTLANFSKSNNIKILKN